MIKNGLKSGGILTRCDSCKLDNTELLLKKADIPKHFSSMTFDTFPGEEDALKFAKRYANEGNSSSLYLWGNTGRGKTGLSKCILEHRIRNERISGLFVTSINLISKIKLGFGDNTSEKYLDHVKRQKILVIDDIGIRQKETEWSSDKMIEIIKYRHDEVLPTIYTSNCRISDLEFDVRCLYLIKESCGEWKYEVLGKNLR